MLALVLAVMMWQLVRGQIETTESVSGVVVEVRDLPADVRLVGGNRRVVSLTLRGPTSDVRRVKAEFVRTPSPAVFRLEAAEGDRGETGSVVSPTKLSYAVEGAAEVVTAFHPPLRFEWFRVIEAEVRVADPRLLPVPGRDDVELLPGSVKMEEGRTVRVRGPIAVVQGLMSQGATIEPDPVDMSPVIRQDLDPSIAFPWVSGFEQWRGQDEMKSPDLLTIQPEKAKGTLRLAFQRSEPLENTLLVLFPPGTRRADYDGWDWEITATGGAYDALGRKLRVGFSAETKVVADLRAKPSQWAFGAMLPAPPKAGETPPANERVPVSFLWLLQDPAPAVRMEGSPSVLVTLKPK